MKHFTAMLFILLVAGCAGPTRYWANPEFTHLSKPERSHQFRKANGYCRMMAESGGPTAQIIPASGNDFAAGWNMGQAFGAADRYDRVYCACMESLGWFQTEE
jgi:hypothetical protein